jgi:hypothetical protein
MTAKGGRMDNLYLVCVLVAGLAIWWKVKNYREPAIIGEVIHSLRMFADARHDDFAKKYRVMADAIQEAQGYAARGEQATGEDRKRIRTALVGATIMDLLEELGFFRASGKAGQARSAIESLWKKVAA